MREERAHRIGQILRALDLLAVEADHLCQPGEVGVEQVGVVVEQAFDFLEELEHRNNRAWFEENKPTYETELKARMLEVIEAVNSRLGVFGYFGHPELADSGTYGLADQQAALRWVRANAAAFGGDPRRVTVFGNSSGGANVCAHLVSPGSAGLFHRAIIQSGSCRQHWPANVMVPGSEPLSYWTLTIGTWPRLSTRWPL